MRKRRIHETNRSLSNPLNVCHFRNQEEPPDLSKSAVLSVHKARIPISKKTDCFQRSALAALSNNLVPPPTTKTSPTTPPPYKANQISALQMTGAWGKFSGSEGGLEGERVTDFATQNLVNSGSAALPSFQEGSLRLQGLSLVPLQGLPLTPRILPTRSVRGSRLSF